MKTCIFYHLSYVEPFIFHDGAFLSSYLYTKSSNNYIHLVNLKISISIYLLFITNLRCINLVNRSLSQWTGTGEISSRSGEVYSCQSSFLGSMGNNIGTSPDLIYSVRIKVVISCVHKRTVNRENFILEVCQQLIDYMVCRSLCPRHNRFGSFLPICLRQQCCYSAA